MTHPRRAMTDPRHETNEHNEPPVQHWRASQPRRLGIPAALAEVCAGRIDWHQIARLVQHGRPPRLALHHRLMGFDMALPDAAPASGARQSREVGLDLRCRNNG